MKILFELNKTNDPLNSGYLGETGKNIVLCMQSTHTLLRVRMSRK